MWLLIQTFNAWVNETMTWGPASSDRRIYDKAMTRLYEELGRKKNSAAVLREWKTVLRVLTGSVAWDLESRQLTLVAECEASSAPYFYSFLQSFEAPWLEMSTVVIGQAVYEAIYVPPRKKGNAYDHILDD